ncbi:MAG: AAA family ATPase [Methyloceanibacter sp.]|uniref:AAA family ATPase n=1 Tax=Methyloceanibacter sp. TaxID=1965321 RepID=UPI003D6D8DD2
MKAFAILRAAALAEAGSPTAYLQTRGLGACPESAMLLPAKDSRRLLGVGFPAMVLPVVGPKGLQGAHVTLLSRDGGAKLAVRDGRPRRMFGKVKGGYAQLAEINLGGTLIIGEGVESTLSAMQLSGWPGIAALSASGLSAVRPPHATEYVIAADNDDSGRAAAAALAERLEYEGKHVRIALPRPEGLDWNDRLRRAKAAEQEWRAALTAENQPAAAAKFHILEDFMELTFPKREMLLAPWLPQPGIAMIFARAGHGKTYLALSIAFAVARGDDLLGWQCERPGRVLYVDGEMPGAYLQTRLSQYGRPPRGTLHIVCRDTFNLRRQAMPDLATPEGRRSIDDIIKQVQPDLVILDSLSTLVRTGEENSPEDWLPVQDWLMSHRWRGRTMLMIHHAGKGGSQRGTSKREDTPETSIKLTKQPRDADAADDESLFELEYMKGREVFGAGEEPLRLRLAIRDGRVTWTHETVRDARKEKVREMLDAGMKQRDIARELGVGEARVSQIKKELTEQGNVVKFPNQRERDA